MNFGHAYIAKKLGDRTSKDRITLNPFKHIDPIGMVSLFVLGLGWGKPVEINPNNLSKKYKNVDVAEAMVAVAGPLFNFLTAFIFYGLYAFTISLNMPREFSETLRVLIYGIVITNISLGVFNLIPLPPLDGYNIIKLVLPKGLKEFIKENQAYILGIVIIGIMFVFSTQIRQLTIAVENIILNIAFRIFGI